MLWKCCTQYASKFVKLSSGHKTRKIQFSFIPKKGNAKQCSNYCTIALILHTSWATVSSWSCSCWLYRASPSLAAKNIISLILVLTICWCPCVASSLVCWKRVVAMTSVFSWQNSIRLCPASFCTPRPNLPVTQGVPWLPSFAFQSGIMKRTSFLGVSSKKSYRSSQNCSTSASSVLLVGA